MYLAIWIHPEPEKADDRIVICRPLLPREGSAIAVLKSRKREGAQSLIISGEGNALRKFITAVDSADGKDSWTQLSDDQLIEAITTLADNSGLSIVDFKDGAEAAVVTAVRKIPKPGFYPRYITKEAKPIWDMVTKEHKSELSKFKSDKMKMWAAAIIIFKRYAAQKSITPFTKDPSQDKVRNAAMNEVNRKANNGNFKALKETETVFAALRSAGLVSRLTNEKFYEAAKHQSMYYITTYRRALLGRNVKPVAVIKELLSTHRYGGTSGKYAHKAIDSGTNILVEPEGKAIHFYIVTSLTRDQIILLFDLDEDVSEAKILKMTGAAGRRWVKTGVLTEPK